MTDNSRFVRRNRVDERDAGVIAAAAGVLAAMAGATPTGSNTVDAALTFGMVAGVTWAAASAPWWALALVAGVAATVALDPLFAAIGAIAFVGGLVVGLRRREWAGVRAVVAGLGLNVLIRSELEGFLGLSALIGVALGSMLFVAGLRRRPAAVRKRGWIGAAFVCGAAALGVVSAGFTALSVRSDLQRASNRANSAIALLNDGSYQEAAQRFDDASSAFARADQQLSGLLGAPARLLPAIAQNMRAGAVLAEAAAAGAATAADALGSIDSENLRVVDGQIDIEAVRAVEGPLIEARGVLLDLRSVSDSIESPWLLQDVRDELDELEDRIDENEPRLDEAIEAAKLSPQLLGANGSRRYLIMFTTPAELMGITGFFGNFADVAIDNGRIDVSRFGRASELRSAVGRDGAACTGCSPQYVDRYGPYGTAIGPAQEFRSIGWANITMPGHFPYVAETTSIVYPQSGGTPIDGVIAMDPYVIQALMNYTGPVAVPEFGLTVAPENAAEFILADQYVLAGDAGNQDRIDALDTIGQQVIRSLLAGALPDPSQLARDLGPLVEEQRLLVWMEDPAERDLFDRVGMGGAFEELGDDGGFGLTVTNGGNSKIDVFLERDSDVRVEVAADGQRVLVADVTLTNNAPPDGLPRYVIGNSRGLPDGTSRMLVTVYGPATLRSFQVDGRPAAELDVYPVAGWTSYSRNEDVPPGGSITVRAEFDLGPSVDGIDDPVVWEQPLASRR